MKLVLGSIGIAIYAVVVLISGWGLLNLDNKGTLEPAINSAEEIIALSVIIIIFILLALSATLLIKDGKKIKNSGNTILSIDINSIHVIYSYSSLIRGTAICIIFTISTTRWHCVLNIWL